MRLVIKFIVNDARVGQEELQVMAKGLVKSFKKRYKHVGVKILPHFSDTGSHIGWKIISLMYVFWLMLVLRTILTCYSILTPENPNNPTQEENLKPFSHNK